METRYSIVVEGYNGAKGKSDINDRKFANEFVFTLGGTVES